MSASVIVFTDLDGTLLDHDDYSYAAARPALARLRETGIPLVLCTSKTGAEILAMRENPDFRDCAAIVENGAGVLPAGASSTQPAPTHARLMRLLQQLPTTLGAGFSGFSSWDAETLIARTGLDPASARRAARRDYSEPGLWAGTDQARQIFVQELAKLGITAQSGGRFMTLGFDANKADRMLEMIADCRAQHRCVTAIALGDAPNDIAMLQGADIGVVIPNPAHAGTMQLAGDSNGHIVYANAAGPVGWNACLLNLLNNPQLEIQGN
jgi:mannosyl-3-phosphoglycerate phosphatase